MPETNIVRWIEGPGLGRATFDFHNGNLGQHVLYFDNDGSYVVGTHGPSNRIDKLLSHSQQFTMHPDTQPTYRESFRYYVTQSLYDIKVLTGNGYHVRLDRWSSGELVVAIVEGRDAGNATLWADIVARYDEGSLRLWSAGNGSRVWGDRIEPIRWNTTSASEFLERGEEGCSAVYVKGEKVCNLTITERIFCVVGAMALTLPDQKMRFRYRTEEWGRFREIVIG